MFLILLCTISYRKNFGDELMGNDLIVKSKEYAKNAHNGQKRKNSDEPYYYHAKRVAKRLQEAGFSDELVAAGYLHDTVEDTQATIDEIEILFGITVAYYVSKNTENKQLSWEERKLNTIEMVRYASLEVKALVVADKFDNLSSFNEQFKNEGEKMWKHYYRGRTDQQMYYTGIVTAMWEGINKSTAPSYFFEFEDLVISFFNLKSLN
jgi:(p)ppGpp synthase/HD superfamily hydrolase